MKTRSTDCIAALFAVIAFLLLPALICSADEKGKEGMTVSEGKMISVEYTIQLKDKSIVHTNAGNPLTYIHGGPQVAEKLQKDMEGMQIGESKLVVIHPEDGYGLSNERVPVEVRKDAIPEGSLKEGARVRGENSTGEHVLLSVKEIKEDTVILEHIPPHDGKTLYYSLKILDIQDVFPK